MKSPIQLMTCALAMLPGLALSQTNVLQNAYGVIAERNVFDLKKLEPLDPPSSVESEPKEDLRLTGLIDVEGCRMALFTVLEAGKPNAYFAVRVGEQNEWLEVKSVNAREGTVKARLKKPAVQLRNVGVEVLLSFREHGLKPVIVHTPGLPVRG